jgi:glutamine amidotransferase
MISLIDYGVGNINAFLNIFKQLGIEATKIKKFNEISKATKLILPGVGSFDDAMSRLNNSGMREALDEAVIHKKIPVIGICVGMQMLAESSEEGLMSGLGWIKGNVKRFEAGKIPYKTKYPHMGWNDLKIKRSSRLLEELDNRSRFYFLHSYYFECSDQDNIIATTDYGIEFASVIGKDNIFGIQCHPEKSHLFGIKLLENFAKI